jgi:multiple RNA-binding domain-containing protein 1
MAYVTFAQPSSAVEAYEKLDKASFQGRLLHILPAIQKRGTAASVEETGKKTLKDARLDQRKAGAGKEFNWSMLYMNVRRSSVSTLVTANQANHTISRPMPSHLR